MKVEAVALEGNKFQRENMCKTMSPELLASVGAKYSRSNKGLDEIYESIDTNDLESSIDNIFKFIDYGHQSISDMVPIPMFIDGISMWAAYNIFAECPTASGQESSTRYIDFSKSDEVLISDKYLLTREKSFYEDMLEDYKSACEFWKSHLERNPSALNLDGFTKKAEINRIKRNYIFDRARYFLPIACKTNVFLLQSARGWVKLVRFLLSSRLKEFVDLGHLIKDQLKIASPRMHKHAKYSSCSFRVADWNFLNEKSRDMLGFLNFEPDLTGAFVSCMPKTVCSKSLKFREHRYDDFTKYTKNHPIRFGWSHIAFGDLRDLNRHRTGEKLFVQKPEGLYYAKDQCFTEDDKNALDDLADGLMDSTQACRDRYYKCDQGYIYLGSLGTQFGFAHLTTMNHFIYEAELRTGKGAHFRYAKHMKDVLNYFYEQEPDLKGVIFEGSCEPE